MEFHFLMEKNIAIYDVSRRFETMIWFHFWAKRLSNHVEKTAQANNLSSSGLPVDGIDLVSHFKQMVEKVQFKSGIKTNP